MSGAVAGIATNFVRPNVSFDKKQRVETWIVPGVPGIGAQKLGVNDSEWSFVLVKFGTNAQCNTWAASINALQSTVVTIEDDWGDTHTQMLIADTTTERKTPAVHALGLGVAGVRCEITISGEIT